MQTFFRKYQDMHDIWHFNRILSAHHSRYITTKGQRKLWRPILSSEWQSTQVKKKCLHNKTKTKQNKTTSRVVLKSQIRRVQKFKAKPWLCCSEMQGNIIKHSGGLKERKWDSSPLRQWTPTVFAMHKSLHTRQHSLKCSKFCKASWFAQAFAKSFAPLNPYRFWFGGGDIDTVLDHKAHSNCTNARIRASVQESRACTNARIQLHKCTHRAYDQHNLFLWCRQWIST